MFARRSRRLRIDVIVRSSMHATNSQTHVQAVPLLKTAASDRTREQSAIFGFRFQ